MDLSEIERALAELPDLEPALSGTGDALTVHVPPIRDRLRLAAADVTACRELTTPDGRPALCLATSHGEVIIMADDVVFEPVEPDAVVETELPYRAVELPGLVAYTEMTRMAERLAQESAQQRIDTDLIAGGMLQLRCIIAGAWRLGMRPREAIRCWDEADIRWGPELPLPHFQYDYDFEELRAEIRN